MFRKRTALSLLLILSLMVALLAACNPTPEPTTPPEATTGPVATEKPMSR